MKPSLQKLQKFLNLEAERGYDNRAVMGGLERMLDRWVAEARAEDIPEELIQVVEARIRDYGRLTPTSRAETLEGLLRRIQRASGENPDAALPLPPRANGATRPDKPAERRPEPPPRADKELPPRATQAETPAAKHAARSASKPSRSQGPSREEPLVLGAPDAGEKPYQETLERAEAGQGSLERIEAEVAYDAQAPEGPTLAPWQVNLPPGAERRKPLYRPVRQVDPPSEPAALNAPVTVLPGVGPKLGKLLGDKLGLHTLRDLLYNLPRRHDDYSQFKPINRLWYGDEVTVIGQVQSVNVRPIRGGMRIAEAVFSDGTGGIRVSWFNQPWKVRDLRPGKHYVLSGKVEQYLGRLVMNNPTVEPLDQEQISTNRIVPVYNLTGKITSTFMRRIMYQVVSYYAPRVQDYLPASVRRSAGLMDLPVALYQAHFPDSWEEQKAARQRVAFDEVFLLQLGVMRQKRAWQQNAARMYPVEDDWLEGQLARLPYALTGAQRRAIQDVRKDLTSGRPMNRLLQGDVGSGKTVVAALAVAMVVRQEAQAAIMAPTSILAEQHYKSMLRLLAGVAPEPAAEVEPPVIEAAEPPGEEATSPAGEEPADLVAVEADTLQSDQGVEAPVAEVEVPSGLEEPAVQPPVEPEAAPAPVVAEPAWPPAEPVLLPSEIRLMIGATPEAEKREIRAGLADGSIKLVIGTHALIEEPVTFANFQLGVVDEQHRFGVEQRSALRLKGENPHLLVMTATPIPRSLALTVYGDLDLSVMDEMPPGRQAVGTYVLPPREIERAYKLIRYQVEQGHQAFIVYPLVEESETSDAKAAVEEHARLQKDIFPRLKLGLLHGRMRPDEKDQVMARFRDGDYHILVSTSVVEVGVDVPNATVMVIEGANRFGLAQLHQFRGRVGRGGGQSYCLLVPDTPDAVENERLQVMAETNDGFVLAERDLDQRGPGEFLGTRQSGYSELKLANLTDLQMIEKARNQAQALFAIDPDLTAPEHQPLASALARFWNSASRTDLS